MGSIRTTDFFMCSAVFSNDFKIQPEGIIVSQWFGIRWGLIMEHHGAPLRESNIAMKNGPFMGECPKKPLFIRDFPLPCLITKGYDVNICMMVSPFRGQVIVLIATRKTCSWWCSLLYLLYLYPHWNTWNPTYWTGWFTRIWALIAIRNPLIRIPTRNLPNP